MAKVRTLVMWAIVIGLIVQGFVHGYRNAQKSRQQAERSVPAAPR